jgi:Dynamin family
MKNNSFPLENLANAQAEEFYIGTSCDTTPDAVELPIHNSANTASPTQEKTTMLTSNIFENITEQAQQVEAKWADVFQRLLDASHEYTHLDTQHFHALNEKFQSALERFYSDLKSPTLILATTGTTSSGKSTIVNLLCGADLMPRMAGEMSAGVVYINHSPDNKKRHLKIHETNHALWECGEWQDLSDDEIRMRLKDVMDIFNKCKTDKKTNQPATPHIELTYPIACFRNKDLLQLTSVPATTKFKIMDLPGLRNQQDNTNGDVIKNCCDALCLVAYNMEETNEKLKEELVSQVIDQVKKMGGSPARMLFVLNRIDVFRKDQDWERYTDEHINKTIAEITEVLNRELPERKDDLKNLSYSRLSSLPALYSQCIRTETENGRIKVAEELDRHFSSLITKKILNDLPRSHGNWDDHHFHRVSEDVWENSYGNEFFKKLDSHIQTNFPTLVIPTIVQRFEEEVSDAVGDFVRTCYSELNSSKEDCEKACELLDKQDAELRGFVDQAEKTLTETFTNLLMDLKKDSSNETILEYLAEDLLKTDIYQGRLSSEKLNPLCSWLSNLRKSTFGVLGYMKQTLDPDQRNVSGISVEKLPGHLQQQLSLACTDYSNAIKKNTESLFEKQLSTFLSRLNNVVNEVIAKQSDVENKRIYEAIELLMTHYLREGVEKIAPQWNLSIGDHILKSLNTPEIKTITLAGKIENKSGKERIWYTLWIAERTIEYKTLPDLKTLSKAGFSELEKQIVSLVEPFHTMIHDYFIELNNKISLEQTRVLKDFKAKLAKASAQHHQNYDNVLRYWQPVHQESEQLADLLKELIKTGKSL